MAEGLDLYRFCGNDPVNHVDVYGLDAYTDKLIVDVRAYVRLEIEAADMLLLPDSARAALFMAGATYLHGTPWSPYNRDGSAFDDYGGGKREVECGAEPMNKSQFANYLTGFTAGYALSPETYWYERAGGCLYGGAGDWWCRGRNMYNDFVGINWHVSYGESWGDAGSVPYIDAGYAAGRKQRIIDDRMKKQVH